jgi:RNA polymerase sigma-70 factor, ECF subfamily
LHDDGLEKLLERARPGDIEALGDLCTRFYPKVLRYMHYRVAADLAEDLTGEVFVRVLRNLAKQRGSFHAWLFRIAERVVTDQRRSAGAKKRTMMTPMTEQHHQQAADKTDVAETVAARVDLEQAIEGLSDDQRQLVTLKFIEGLGNEDVASIMDRSLGAIRVLQFRALSELRSLMAGKEVRGGA